MNERVTAKAQEGEEAASNKQVVGTSKGRGAQGGITDGEGVAGGAEGAVDEGAEREWAAERGEDLAEHDWDVVGVGVAEVEVGVEGGS